MSQYKELADRLEGFAAGCCIPDDENTPPREAAAILRSLDAQRPAVDEVMDKALLLAGCSSMGPLAEYSKVKQDLRTAIEALAAPVAAQPTFEKGSWQHAVDDQLVGFGRTSQEFGSPHDAVRWLIEQEVQAAQPTEQKKCNLISDEDSCQATEIIRCLTCHRHVSGPCNTPAQPQQAKPLSDEEIAFCIFESKMKNPAITRDGTTSIRIARAAIAAFCQKNGIKEQG